MTGRRRYEGLGFHRLRRASGTGLVAAGVDVKTAQSMLGLTDARGTLDPYAQVVTEQQQAAADANGRPLPGTDRAGLTRGRGRFLWMSRSCQYAARGPVSRPSLTSRVGEI
jgi:hypothetical protein